MHDVLFVNILIFNRSYKILSKIVQSHSSMCLINLLLVYLVVQCPQIVHSHHISPWRTVADSEPDVSKLFKYLPALKEDQLPRFFRDHLQESCDRRENSSCGHGQCNPLKYLYTNLEPKGFNMYTHKYPISPYECHCPDGQSPVQVYNKDRKSVDMACHTLHNCGKCHPEYSITCTTDPRGKLECLCREGYSSQWNCKKQENGCTTPHAVSNMDGNTACGVKMKNICVPSYASPTYYCKCRKPYSEDTNLPYPNCNHWDNHTCEKKICTDFTPLNSTVIPDGMIILPSRYGGQLANCDTNKCECAEGYRGTYCTKKEYMVDQTTFSEWSPCYPDCLQTGEIQKRVSATYVGSTSYTKYGHSSRFGRCPAGKEDYCYDMTRMWRRCRLTNLCNIYTEGKLSTVVNEAVNDAIKKLAEVIFPVAYFIATIILSNTVFTIVLVISTRLIVL